jgi:hypothetical protein
MSGFPCQSDIEGLPWNGETQPDHGCWCASNRTLIVLMSTFGVCSQTSRSRADTFQAPHYK